uniref:Uncharacterized protein n=1 Tax=Trypanosoma congolense (strain IL3000) TaxID=1068625 RepID=G0UN27_TRYCI|nr:conserved hypothetical protein [Trypanosoma congolense IL3000]
MRRHIRDGCAVWWGRHASGAQRACSSGHSGGTGLHLPDPPYKLPQTPRFNAERSGIFDKNWLSRLPALKPAIRNSTYLPSKEVLWQAPIHQALEIVIEHLPYHDALRYITEHSFFFLFPTILKASDAPLPHVVYEDLMKCCTFASLQNPPEEQFALPPALLRTLLCTAAYHCTLDAEYFTTCQMLFCRMEQQQQATSEVLSAWVYCCAASGKVEEALTYAKYMAGCNVPFDLFVFSLMQHPSLNPIDAEHGPVSQPAKGLLLQQRLGRRMHTAYLSDSLAAHGIFVYYALTLNHVKKWEVIRAAADLRVVLSDRTLELAVEVFAREKGMRCGPKTVKAMTLFLSKKGSAGHLLYVLLRARKNELLPEFCDLPRVSYSREQSELVLDAVQRRAQRDDGFAAANPLIRALVLEEDPHELLKAFSHAARVSSADYGEQNGDIAPDAQPTHSPICGEVSWTSTRKTIRSLLCAVDELDRSGRRAALPDRRQTALCGSTAAMAPEGLRYSSGAVAVDPPKDKSDELLELQRGDIPVGIRELARLNVVGELKEAQRARRVAMAWVNPDGMLWGSEAEGMH